MPPAPERPADQELAERMKRVPRRGRSRPLHPRLSQEGRGASPEEGFRQFLDIGTGLPTADNTHEVAQKAVPETRIVYVDHDPIVLAHARALLTSTPEGETDYIDADLNAPDNVLTQAARTLDLNEPVALMLMSVISHVTEPRQAVALVQEYVSRLAPGSALVMCTTLASPEIDAANKSYADSGTQPYVASSAETMWAMADGLTIPAPGLGPISRWHPGADGPEADTQQWGYIAYKSG
ncbi:hypothetical protein GTY83_00405 [Streptomyces sp. SID4928]|nr:SAM-dependent methyltransferase [Streptomyces sp. ACT-1]MYR47593.1 hypothetical protein [Streptomyces sp. SID4928]